MQAEDDEEDFVDLTFSTIVASVTSGPQRDEAFVKLKLRLPNRPGQHNIIFFGVVNQSFLKAHLLIMTSKHLNL